MATKEINTRIENKIDTLANWSASNLPLLNGEIAIVRVPAGSNYANLVTNETEPAELLMKIGNGSATFAALPWLSAKAADVYDWAKNEQAKDVPVTITTGTGQDAKTETNTLGAWLKTIYDSNTTQNAYILSNTDAINKLNEDSDTVGSVAYTIKAAIDELNSTTSGSGDFVKAVIQTNGKILVTKGTITESDIPELPASKIVITPASSDIAKVTLTNKLAEVDSDISNLSNRLDEVKIQEVYVGDGNMPEDATIQILMDGSDEEQALKYELKEYIDVKIETQVQAVCIAKNQGASNVGKILVVGTDGNLTLADMPEGGASGDVIGVLDEANNILLSGNLADGTYTLKYENADGTYTEVGTLEVGAIPEPEPVKTNFAGTLTVGRLSNGAEGNISDDSTSGRVTEFIAVQNGDILTVQGYDTSATIYTYMVFNSSKAKVGTLTKANTSSDYVTVKETTSNGGTLEIISDSINFIRVCGFPSGAEEDVIVNIKRNGEWL